MSLKTDQLPSKNITCLDTFVYFHVYLLSKTFPNNYLEESTPQDNLKINKLKWYLKWFGPLRYTPTLLLAH